MQTLFFLDDGVIAKTYKLSRRLNYPRPVQENPILTATEGWESLLCAYGSVLYDEGLFKAYYTQWWLDDTPPYSCRAEALAYAYSEDGLHWTKPELHIVDPVNGGRNNLIRYGLFADQPCVVRLREPRGGKRYVMAYYGDFAPLGPGVRVCFSADGIHWDWPGELVWKTAIDAVSDRLDFYAADDTLNFYFDPGRQAYVLVRKVMQDTDLAYDPARHGHWKPDRDRLQRMIARRESADLVRWSDPQMILAPDCEDAPLHDFHRLGITPYAGQYIGLLEMHDGQPGNDRIAAALVASADGFTWTRPCRPQQPFIANGAEDAWDGGVIFVPPQFLVHQGEIFIYYGGMQARLTAESMGKCKRSGIGLAKLPRDRFCSLQARAGEAGLLVTQPVVIRESAHVNAVTGDAGFVRAALCTPAGEPLAGFGWEDGDPIAGDVTRAPLTWNGRAVPGPDTYCLSIRIKDADLYALYIA